MDKDVKTEMRIKPDERQSCCLYRGNNNNSSASNNYNGNNNCYTTSLSCCTKLCTRNSLIFAKGFLFPGLFFYFSSFVAPLLLHFLDLQYGFLMFRAIDDLHQEGLIASRAARGEPRE